MSEISTKIEQLIKLGVTPLLEKHLFKKVTKTFYRQQDGIWQVVNIQSSQSNFGSAGKFTINFGLYHPVIAEIADKAIKTSYPKEYECTLRKRIGSLLPEQKDFWWEINPATNLEVMVQQVSDAIERFGLPWLDSHCNTKAIADRLSDQPSIMSAASAMALGDKIMARQQILQMVMHRPLAASTARVWAEKHGLEL